MNFFRLIIPGFILLLYFTFRLSAQTQPVETLKTCLVLKMPQSLTPANLTPDPVEGQRITGQWRTPVPGETLEQDGFASETWTLIQADADGWFTHPALQNGYACFIVELPEEQTLLLEGMGHSLVSVNGVPRVGNPYQHKENFEDWEPRFDYSLLPVFLEAGRNELLFRCNRGRLKVKLHLTRSRVQFNARDLTVPDVLVGELLEAPAAIVILNLSLRPVSNLGLVSEDKKSVPKTFLPMIPPLSVRKVRFPLQIEALVTTGERFIQLNLFQKNGLKEKWLDSTRIKLRVLEPGANHKRTFVSQIDGSVQYFAVNPAHPANPAEPAALFLTVHGAGVEALNQSGAYAPKTWGHIVAPTNRRPFGFNWEDWGRIDALEVYDLARESFKIDSSRIYLTGHSMGGHGTWHLGALFPDRFAALGPSAGWISFATYRARPQIAPVSVVTEILNRAGKLSDTFAFEQNYCQHGIYILHGGSDDVVPPEESRQMVVHLEKFHPDYHYHEQAGAGHWWDLSPEPGADCVDWPPMFEFFAGHVRPPKNQVREIEFVTANPGVSANCHWLVIEAQIRQLAVSHAAVRCEPENRRFVGTTENIARLALELNPLASGADFSVELDQQRIAGIAWPESGEKIWLENKEGAWQISSAPNPAQKGPRRYGPFKEAFNHRMIFVYGTTGNRAENAWALAKARLDAEIFWYQGNGSVDVIPDVAFNPTEEPDRNVILYGNAQTNAAWKRLLAECPVQVTRQEIRVGDRTLRGTDLACLFVYPRAGSATASVGVVAGTGISGLQATNRQPYLYPGYGFPDCLIFSPDIYFRGAAGIRVAGFFGLDWSVSRGEFVFQ